MQEAGRGAGSGQRCGRRDEGAGGGTKCGRREEARGANHTDLDKAGVVGTDAQVVVERALHQAVELAVGVDGSQDPLQEGRSLGPVQKRARAWRSPPTPTKNRSGTLRTQRLISFNVRV